MEGDASLARRHSGRLRLPALAGRSGAAGDLYREGDRARAAPGLRRRAARDQRADPLFAGRQPLYRHGARLAELLSGVLLLLRHLELRPAEPRVGQECVISVISWLSPYQSQKTNE